MSFRNSLMTLIIGALAAWFGFWLVISSTSPNSGTEALFLFYATIGFAVFGTSAVIGLVARRVFFRNVLDVALPSVLRQALLSSILCLILLALLAHDLFVWWIVVLIVGVLVLVECAARFYRNPSV